MAVFGDMLRTMIKNLASEDDNLNATDRPGYLHESTEAPDAEGHLLRENTEEEMAASLLKTRNNMVHDLGTFNALVDSEWSAGPGGDGREAQATPPIEFQTTLADNWEAGKNVTIQGPHGIIEVMDFPPDAKPGASLRFRIAPPPEFRLTIPSTGVTPGQNALFVRPDGVEISVTVPATLMPGDCFDVLPPALMVRVPPATEVGAYVVFRHPQVGSEWIRAKVPANVPAGQYFAARMPLPKKLSFWSNFMSQ